jgi:hypothetical protein
MIVSKRWYKEEHDRLLAIVKQRDLQIRELQGHAADLAFKVERYEMYASETLKKKVAKATADAKAGKSFD